MFSEQDETLQVRAEGAVEGNVPQASLQLGDSELVAPQHLSLPFKDLGAQIAPDGFISYRNYHDFTGAQIDTIHGHIASLRAEALQLITEHGEAISEIGFTGLKEAPLLQTYVEQRGQSKDGSTLICRVSTEGKISERGAIEIFYDLSECSIFSLRYACEDFANKDSETLQTVHGGILLTRCKMAADPEGTLPMPQIAIRDSSGRFEERMSLRPQNFDLVVGVLPAEGYDRIYEYCHRLGAEYAEIADTLGEIALNDSRYPELLETFTSLKNRYDLLFQLMAADMTVRALKLAFQNTPQTLEGSYFSK